MSNDRPPCMPKCECLSARHALNHISRTRIRDPTGGRVSPGRLKPRRKRQHTIVPIIATASANMCCNDSKQSSFRHESASVGSHIYGRGTNELRDNSKRNAQNLRRIIKSAPARCANPGARILHLYGRLEPSLRGGHDT